MQNDKQELDQNNGAKTWQKPEIEKIEIAETAGMTNMGNDGGGGMTGS